MNVRRTFSLPLFLLVAACTTGTTTQSVDRLHPTPMVNFSAQGEIALHLANNCPSVSLRASPEEILSAYLDQRQADGASMATLLAEMEEASNTQAVDEAIDRWVQIRGSAGDQARVCEQAALEISEGTGIGRLLRMTQ